MNERKKEWKWRTNLINTTLMIWKQHTFHINENKAFNVPCEIKNKNDQTKTQAPNPTDI